MTSGTDSTTLSRRAAMAAATMTPMVTFATGVDASAVDPDADLVHLGRLRETLVNDLAVLEARESETYDQFEASLPPKPDVLKVQSWDWTQIGTSPRQKIGDVISHSDLDRVKEYIGHNRRAFDSCGVNKICLERGIAVAEALEAWQALYLAHREASGLNAIQAEVDDFAEAISGVEKRIMSLTAHTKAGLRVKATVVDAYKWNDAIGNVSARAEYLNSLLNDLLQDA